MTARSRLVPLVAAGALVATVANAQLAPGTDQFYGAYEIQFNGSVIGHVVVVHASPPSGYAAETEYWHWVSGQAWRGAFKLVPIATVPSHSAFSWQTFPHDHFDLSGTVSFPAVDPDPGDTFYRVSVKSGASWLVRGYAWVIGGTTQEWYGKGLTADTIGGGAEIRFESVEPPSPGSESVYLLE